MSLFTEDLRFSHTCLTAYRILQKSRECSKGLEFLTMFEMMLSVVYEQFKFEIGHSLPPEILEKCDSIVKSTGVINKEISVLNQEVIKILPRELIEIGKLFLSGSEEPFIEENIDSEEENEIVGEVEDIENKVGIMIETSFGEVTPKKTEEKKKKSFIEEGEDEIEVHNFSAGGGRPLVPINQNVVIGREVEQEKMAKELEMMLEEEEAEISYGAQSNGKRFFDKENRESEVHSDFDQKISTFEFQSSKDQQESSSGIPFPFKI